MTDPKTHPDAERLAAWQAGDLDAERAVVVESHVQACPQCSGEVARLDRVRELLAAQPLPELPAGLHERLLATADAPDPAAGRLGAPLAAEAPVPVTDGQAEVTPVADGRARRRLLPVPVAIGHRRDAGWQRWRGVVATLAAAAVVAALVLGVRELHLGNPGTPSAAATAVTPPPAATRGPALRSVTYSGNLTPTGLRRLLGEPGIAAAVPLAAHAMRSSSATGTAASGALAPAGTPAGSVNAAEHAACVLATQRLAGPGQRPVLLVRTSWQHRPATVVLLASEPGLVRSAEPVTVLVMAGGSCSGRLLAQVHTTAAGLGLAP